MAKLDLQYDLINYTPASASPVEANFSRIEQHVNQEVVERGGTVAMTAQLKLFGDPVSPLDAASKQYVDQMLPVGIIMMFGGTVVPIGGRWALCNGAEMESATNAALFAVIGNNFSPAGTPAGRFHLPNMNSKFPYGGTPGSTGGTADAVVVNHSHPIDHTHPAHTHVGADHLHNDDHNHHLSFNTSTASANHTHGPAVGSKFVNYQAGGGLGTGAGATNDFLIGDTTGAAGADHVHGVTGDTNYKSQQGYGPTTGAADRTLTTSGTADSYAGASGNASSGVAGTNANIPPYLGVNYIMRIS